MHAAVLSLISWSLGNQTDELDACLAESGNPIHGRERERHSERKKERILHVPDDPPRRGIGIDRIKKIQPAAGAGATRRRPVPAATGRFTCRARRPVSRG
jgi:hypothetical protein